MNIKALNGLIDLLENLPPEKERGFNMSDYHSDDLSHLSTHTKHECNSVSCIAGWAALYMKTDGTLLKRPRDLGWNFRGYMETAQGLLGLTQDQSLCLFEPMFYVASVCDKDWDAVTPVQAVKVLKHLRDTGEVNWDLAFA